MSFIKEKRLIIIVVLCMIISHAFAQKINAAQRAEIDKLRSELDAAFEQHEEQQLQIAVQKGTIVQPQWTQQTNDKKPAKEQSKVIVTNEGLSEVEALRAEIKKAASIAPDAKKVQKLEAELSKKGSTKSLTSSTKVTVGSSISDSHPQRNAGSNVDDDDYDENAPNIIEANDGGFEPDIDIRKLQRLELSKRRTREMLILAHIEEDFSFDLGDDVQEWDYVLHNGSEYFVGLRQNDLLLVQHQLNDNRYVPVQTINITLPMGYLACYQYWNHKDFMQEGVILLALDDQVHWYRYNGEQQVFTDDWQWHVGTTVTGLTHFAIDERHFIVVSSNQSTRAGYYVLTIYEYDLLIKEFWLVQRMQLENASSEVAVLDTGRDILLAVAQLNKAAIYTYNPREDSHMHFQLKYTIESEQIKHVAAFQMGGRSYLALGGLEPQILHYAQGVLHPKTILGNNFGLVELFFPVPVRTYRDDLLLLVQHRVDFGTHSLVVLETLIWNGEAFETSIPVPCQLGEHVVYGVSCMLDMDRDMGLRGAALLRRGEIPLLIVPRQMAESGLFRLHTTLLAKNSELLDLQEIWTFLQDWVEEQNILTDKARKFISFPPDQIDIELKKEYDTLATPEFIYDGEFNEFYINDYMWMASDTEMDLYQLINEVRALEKQLHGDRSKRNLDVQNFTYDYLDCDEVLVDDLEIEQLNNSTFFIQNNTINFDGLLNLQDLIVLNELQSNEIRPTFEKKLKLNGDLKFKSINGIEWSELVEALIYRDKSLVLDNLEVKGEVIIEDKLQIEVLNELSFPEDYLWSNSAMTSKVQGEKNFTGILTASAIDTDGLVNGVNPLDAITLTTAQDWPGLQTFAALEVSKIFELNDLPRERNFEEESPTNSTLLETRLVTADCNFKELIVKGPIKVKNLFDDEAIVVLDDIVQRPSNPENEIIISSAKEFMSIVALPVDLQIADASLSGIPIEQFIPKHTNQTLRKFKKIQGNVYFHKLQQQSPDQDLYDGVNLAKLLEEALRIDKPLNASTTQLNFVDGHELNGSSTNLEIRQTLNDIPLTSGYQKLNEDLKIKKAGQFINLKAKIAHVHGNGIIGENQKLNGINLSDFLQENRPESTSSGAGNIFLNDLYLPKGLQTDELHGINASLVLDFLQQIDELPLMILSGQLQVDSVHVQGSVLVKEINNQSFDEDIKNNVIWLNRPNYFNTQFTFLDEVVFMDDLNILGNYNGRNMPDFVDDIVFRNANTTTPNGNILQLGAPRKFLRNVFVHDAVEVEAINGIPFEYLAKNYGVIEFQGNLLIRNAVQIYDLHIKGHLNNYPMSRLDNQLVFIPEMGAFMQRGVIHMPSMPLEDLTVYGHYGNSNITSLSAFFDKELIYKSDTGNCKITGLKTFSGRISINSGATIDELNDEYNLKDLLKNIVYINEPLPVMIQTPVSFNAPIELHAVAPVEIHGDLITRNLQGSLLEDWLEQTLRVDQSMNFSRFLEFVPGTLDNNAFFVSFLNEVDLSKLITLYTPQNLSSPLLFNELYLPEDGVIEVKTGMVNNEPLLKAYENTLMTTGNQTVKTPIIMKSIHVLGDLTTHVPINDGQSDLRSLATLQTGRVVIESPLYFKELSADDLKTNDRISGIDFNAWYKQTLWSSGIEQRPLQWITGNWSVRNLIVKQEIGLQKRLKRQIIEEQDDYKEMCNTLMTIKKQFVSLGFGNGYYIKYLELHHVMNVSLINHNTQQIRRIFLLQFGQDNYLLINAGCWSILYKWHKAEQRFYLLNSFESGPLDEVKLLKSTVTTTPSLQFITSYVGTEEDYGCIINDTQIWRTASDEARNSTITIKITNDFDDERKEIRSIIDIFLSSPFLAMLTPPPPLPLILASSPRLISITQVPNRKELQKARKLPPKYIVRPTTESILKPQINDKENFTFADFRSVIVRILDDLIYRLHAEINITQLSIPESDLYDEHLIVDFLAVMRELREQRIYSNETFAQLRFEEMVLPSNPAQVLAARAVQIIWPVIVEIEEIHGYLLVNETHAHPICELLKSRLGLVICDVLELAYSEEKQKEENDMKTLYAVITKIRHFQDELLNISQKLKQMDDKEKPTKRQFSLSNMMYTDYDDNRDHSDNNKEQLREKNHLINSFKIIVGPASSPRLLFTRTKILNAAAFASKNFPSSEKKDLLEIYEKNTGLLLQKIATQEPRLFTTIRIRDVTLLAFVENCCSVKILIYQGIQGFVEFADFKTPTKIIQLTTHELPKSIKSNKDKEIKQILYTIIVSLSDELRIYEVNVKGQTMDPHPSSSITNTSLNC